MKSEPLLSLKNEAKTEDIFAGYRCCSRGTFAHLHPKETPQYHFDRRSKSKAKHQIILLPQAPGEVEERVFPFSNSHFYLALQIILHLRNRNFFSVKDTGGQGRFGLC
jgi:hypothetical protein